MSRNGSGVYSLPAGNPVVTGTTISSSWANSTLSDIATALTGSVAADGQTAMTGNLQMGGNKITGLAVATASGDALSFGQAATISALTVSGAFAANGGATLGDASGDALTINSSAVSIPNGLNFDSNTLVIDATNNRVGVGTSSPSVRFQVSSSTAADGAIARLELTNTSVFGGDKYGQLQFFGNDSSSTASGIRAYVNGDATGSNGEAAIVFGTANTNAAVAERMRIDSSGNVGIGTSSPAQKLTLGANNAFRMQTGSVTMDCTPTPGGIDGFVWNLSAGYYDWAIGGTSRMRIDSSGNLLFNSGYGSVATAYGCRAWVSFNGNPISIRGSGNVSSITDGGVGIYTVNFTTAMPDATYGIAVASEAGGGSGNKGPYINNIATGSLGVFVYNGGGSLVDASPVNVAIFR